MRTLRHIAALTAASIVSVAATATSQGLLHAPASFTPQFGELPFFNDSPWLRDDARFQQFYSAAEMGSAQFVATQLDLRFDGPIPAVGIPGPFAINRLTIDVGVTTAEPGVIFAENLSQPLTRVFDGPHSYLPDADGQTPAPWGGPGGGMSFAFNAPVPITIPAGGFFVVEFRIEGNGINGAAHAILDVAPGAGRISEGAAINFGQGCPAGAGMPDATISAAGLYSDGGAYQVTATDLGANAVAALFIGDSNTAASFGALPLQLPGTSCSLLTNSLFSATTIADASGAIVDGNQVTLLRIPLTSALAGTSLFHQFASLVPGANPFGIVLSDALEMQYGISTPRVGGYFAVINDEDPDGAIATDASELGYAMRITTQ